MQNFDIIPRPTALFESIADSLRDRILTHELPPGAHIDECALARELGVSRTPVREALKVLARDGFVTFAHRKNIHCTVTEYTSLELAALLKLIEQLELFQLEWHDNPFVPELVRRVTDKLYLAVGPEFFSADVEAKKQFKARSKTIESGSNKTRNPLSDYFAWRRLEVAKRVMVPPRAAS
jgi:DNA-binding transcriptional regulator YhcF (GntR family)